MSGSMLFLNNCNILYKSNLVLERGIQLPMQLHISFQKCIPLKINQKNRFVFFMDLSQAFVTINIEILIKKLNHYGIRGVPNSWFKPYLKGRKQLINITSHESENMWDILHGVPQETILGPLLFSLYIDDFRKCLSFPEAILFADDTTLLFKEKVWIL